MVQMVLSYHVQFLRYFCLILDCWRLDFVVLMWIASPFLLLLLLFLLLLLLFIIINLQHHSVEDLKECYYSVCNRLLGPGTHPLRTRSWLHSMPLMGLRESYNWSTCSAAPANRYVCVYVYVCVCVCVCVCTLTDILLLVIFQESTTFLWYQFIVIE